MAALMAFALVLLPVALSVYRISLYYLLPSIWLDTVDYPKSSFPFPSCHV